MEQKAKITALKVNIICFFVSLIVSILYLGGGEILAWNDLYFRTWVVRVGELFVFVFTPVLLLLIPALAAGQAAKRRQTDGMRTAATVVWVLAGIIGFAYLAAGTLVYAFLRADSIERESWLTEDIIEGVHTEYYGRMETYPVYRYYEPYTVFLKKSYEPMSEIIEKKAQERYGEKFTVSRQDKEREQEEKIGVYTLVSDSNPELVMHMYAGNTVYGFSCDYPQARANWLLGQDEAFAAIAEFPQEPGEPEEGGIEDVLTEAPVVPVYDEEDGEAKAQTIAAAIQKVRKDVFFAEYGKRDACLYLELHYEDGNTNMLPLYFDGMEAEAGNAAENTTQETEQAPGNTTQQTKQLTAYITEQISQRYGEHSQTFSDSGKAEAADGQSAEQTDGQSTEQTDGQSTEQTEGQSAEQTDVQPQEEAAVTPQTVEGAYLCLYEQIFKEQGAVYDCNYNAKGNFYAFLSEGRDVPDGGTEELRAEYTVVYDRESKNGKCHLFAYYETFYNEDGTEYGTAILDLYAVNKETGEVTASGKHAWAGVGTAEYQEATGEK